MKRILENISFSASEPETVNYTRLDDILLTRAHLFEREFTAFTKTEAEAKYNAEFAISKMDETNIEKIDLRLNKILGKKASEVTDRTKSSKTCFQDGDLLVTKPEYKGYWVIRSNNLAKPRIYNEAGREVFFAEGDYESQVFLKPGCRVNALLHFVYYTNSVLWAKVISVQKVADGTMNYGERAVPDCSAYWQPAENKKTTTATTEEADIPLGVSEEDERLLYS